MAAWAQALLLFLASLATPVFAIDAPLLSLRVAPTTIGGRLVLQAEAEESFDGLNLYHNGRYRSTHFSASFTVPALSGSFCVVAFRETTNALPTRSAVTIGDTQYSQCSNTVEVAAADLQSLAAALPAPLPSGLHAVVYSTSALELYWDRVDSARTAIHPVTGEIIRAISSYRIYRDDVLIGQTEGNSFWEMGLQAGERYRYRVSAIHTETELTLSPSLTVLMQPGRYDADVSSPPLSRQNANAEQSDAGAPPERVNGYVPGLTAQFYSPTVAELFWARAPDASVYRVLRNGEMIGETDGTSYFEALLPLGNAYGFTVVAVAEDGRELGASVIELEFDPMATLADTAAELDGDTNLSAALIELQVPTEVFELDEGAAETLRVPFSIVLPAPLQTVMQISVQALDDWPGSTTSLRLSHQQIPPGIDRLDASVSVQLPVGVRPLSFHERRLRITVGNLLNGDSHSADIRYRVKPVRAADVYLLVGQSNMEGFSRVGTRERFPGGLDEGDSRIRQLNVTSNNVAGYDAIDAFTSAESITGSPLIITAEDPLHELRYSFQSAKGGTYIGPGLAFAKAMLPHTTQEILLVPAAWSGTGFCRSEPGNLGWNPDSLGDSNFAGTQLFDRALARLEIALRQSNGVLRGILWHQGEADSNNPVCASAYADNLKKMVRAFRTRSAMDKRGADARNAVANIPFIVGTMSRGADERGSFATFGVNKQLVDTVHRTIESHVPHAAVVLNDDLLPPAYPCGNSSCVHFGAAAYREMGQRYARALQQIWGR